MFKTKGGGGGVNDFLNTVKKIQKWYRAASLRSINSISRLKRGATSISDCFFFQSTTCLFSSNITQSRDKKLAVFKNVNPLHGKNPKEPPTDRRAVFSRRGAGACLKTKPSGTKCCGGNIANI